MKSIRDNTRRPTLNQPVLVEFTITVTEAEAFWLVVNSEAIAITPQTMASRIVSDVIKDDVAMEREQSDETMH